MYRKFREIWLCGLRGIRADKQKNRQTDRQTETLIAIRRPPSGGRRKKGTAMARQRSYEILHGQNSSS